MKYIFFKKEPPKSITDNEIYGLRELKKESKAKTFKHQGQEYKFNEVSFIGEKCHNEQCNRPQHAHPLDEVCDYSLTGNCSECNKDLWEKDRAYSIHKWKNAFCYDHSPMGKTMGPKPGTKDERMMNAYIYGLIKSGVPEDEAITRGNEILEHI